MNVISELQKGVEQVAAIYSSYIMTIDSIFVYATTSGQKQAEFDIKIRDAKNVYWTQLEITASMKIREVIFLAKSYLSVNGLEEFSEEIEALMNTSYLENELLKIKAALDSDAGGLMVKFRQFELIKFNEMRNKGDHESARISAQKRINKQDKFVSLDSSGKRSRSEGRVYSNFRWALFIAYSDLIASGMINSNKNVAALIDQNDGLVTMVSLDSSESEYPSYEEEKFNLINPNSKKVLANAQP